MNDDCKNLVVVGVGGQGIVLVSRIIGEAALKSDLNVMISEIHGMAQRGGVVRSTIRIGDAHSPMIGKGEADMILGMEPVESYRHLDVASKKTTIVMNTNPIYPFTVATKDEEYPDLNELIKNMEEICYRIIKLDAESLVAKANLPVIVTNIIMLGALAGASEDFPLNQEKLIYALKENVPLKFVDENIKAFKLGYEQVKGSI